METIESMQTKVKASSMLNAGGYETTGQSFILNGKTGKEILEAEAKNKFNDSVEEYTQKLKEENEAIKKAAQNIVDRAEDLEILPIESNLLVQPYGKNPFQKIEVTESGLILNYQAPGFTKGADDGKMHEDEEFIKVASVVAVGPKCKYIKEGDIIMYTKPSQVPLPFFNAGFYIVPEGRVMAVVNENLTERFKEIKL